MTLLLRTALALAVAAGASLPGAVQAQNLAVSEATTGSYLYTYSVTPAADTSSLTFSFFDKNVSYVSETGPLTQEFNYSPGGFLVYSFTGSTLKGGSTETVGFSSPDAPGSFVNITSIDGTAARDTGGATAIGPAAVPEASTTLSFGLLLMLGLGGVMIAAKKKKAVSS